MSIYIKGMDMPQAGDVIVCGQIDGKLQATIVTRGKQTKWCEILEIPTPHGDLIDRNKIDYCDYDIENSRTFVSMTAAEKEWIDEMPAIIKAED